MGALKLEDLPHYTYDDYVNWEGDWELISGIPYAMSPSPKATHQMLANMIAVSLTNSIDKCKQCLIVSELDYRLSNDTVVRPDISLMCGQKDGAYIQKSPEIIVEIVSKNSAKRDENIKFALYEQEKVKYYILVYPDDLHAKIYKLENNKYEKVDDFLSGKYKFEETKCNAEIDFDFIYERFKD